MSRRWEFSCWRVTPASTVQSRSSALTRTIRVMRERSTVTPPRMAETLPSSEVPAPNGMTGTPCSAQSRTIAATSSVEVGNTTASGDCVR